MVVPIPVTAVAPTGAKAAAQEAAVATKAATAASTEHAAALQLEGAAAQKVAAQQVALTRAEELAAVASARAAQVEKAGVLATTELARAKAVLRASSASAAAAESAFTAAVATQQPALIAAANTAKALAVAQLQAAEATALQAAASSKAAPAIAKHAAAQEQLARGAGATALSLLGARGATLAAGSSFLIGAAAVTGLAKAVKGASEDEEALADVTKILGERLGGELDAGAGKLAATLGIVDERIVRFQSALALIFKNVGLADEATVGYSETLLRLARDISSVKDVPVEQTFKAIQSALLGNLRGLRQLGIGLSAAQIRQEALAESGKDQAKSLTEQEIVLARYSLLLKNTSVFTGAWAEEQERLAGKTQVLTANIDQLADTIGKVLIPFIDRAIGTGNDLATVLRAINEESKKRLIPEQFQDDANDFEQSVKEIASVALNLGPEALGRLADAVSDSGDEAKGASTDWFGLEGILRAVSAASDALAATLENLARASRLVRANIAGLSGQLLDIQFAGGGSEQQIANLQKQLALAEEAVRIADEIGKGQLKARQERNRIQDQIQAIREKDAAAAEAARRADEQAAAEAQRAAEEARRAHDARIQEAIERQQGLAEIKLINAEATKGLLDDIKAQIQIRNLIRRQIAVLVPQIQDVKLRNQVLLALKTAEAQTKAAIQALFKERAEARRAEREAAREALREARENLIASIELDIQLAQTSENVKGEIRARQALIKALQAQQKLFKRGTLEWKRLRNEIAAERKAIADLKKEAKGRGKDFSELAFEFLQQQQGFAANLLGNLFPGSAAAGVVGGTSGAGISTLGLTPAGPSRPGFPTDTTGGRGEGIITGLSAQAQLAGTARGTTQGQTATMIEILRQILRTLQAQRRGSEHPEARSQRAVGSAVMDIM